MIKVFRKSLYAYLIGGSNPFITLLGAGNLSYKHPIGDKDFPYCFFTDTSKGRSIDSGNKFIRGELTFMMYDGSNDKVKESTISADNLEDTVEALDDMLDLQENAFTVLGYSLVQLKQKSISGAPTVSNSVHGAKLVYNYTLQKVRSV